VETKFYGTGPLSSIWEKKSFFFLPKNVQKVFEAKLDSFFQRHFKIFVWIKKKVFEVLKNVKLKIENLLLNFLKASENNFCQNPHWHKNLVFGLSNQGILAKG
jgi:hypothetical protein